MAAAKKKKFLTYKGKPLIRCGQKLCYGNINVSIFLCSMLWKQKNHKDILLSKKVKFYLMDNTGDLGKGQIYRRGERENLYKALDIGEWWLKDALQSA